MPPAISDDDSPNNHDAAVALRKSVNAPSLSKTIQASNGTAPELMDEDEDEDEEVPGPQPELQGEENGSDDDAQEAEGEAEKENAEEELDEDEFVIEEIISHMIDADGSLKFRVKWEGYDKESDQTWEPEENLKESASEILEDYIETLGGRDKVIEESYSAVKGKKRPRSSASTPTASSKRSKKTGKHPLDAAPTASGWRPPAGSWEDEIQEIDAAVNESNRDLVVYLTWKNGQKSRHSTTTIYKRCPQKMLQFYERHIKIVTPVVKTE